MENNPGKLHLMISSVDSQQSLKDRALDVYVQTEIQYDFKSVKTMQLAIDNESPSLISIKKGLEKKGNSTQILTEMLQLMIAKAARAFNVTRQIEVQQIKDFVELLEEEFYFIKLSEVYFVLREARLGKYGNTYEGLDGVKMMGWFNQYVEQRVGHFENKGMLKHNQATGDEKGRVYDGFVVKLIIKEQNQEQERIKNLAYAMAKKMTANHNDQQEFQKPSTPPDSGKPKEPRNKRSTDKNKQEK